MSKKLTTEEFIEKAKAIHGNKYDYSKVNYVNNKIKIIIGCNTHGEFTQTPNSHLSGHKCFKCTLISTMSAIRYNIEEFIEKARAIHGDKYDYSKSIYINSHAKIKIICPTHGEFAQTPHSHLYYGCAKCAGVGKLTTEEFIEKARSIHGDKYNYSKVNYINSKTKVIISCNIHGDFLMIPNNHLNGDKCPKCSGKKLTTKEFIEKARSIHADKYDYSKVNYINGKEHIIIICPIHGEFKQSATGHLSGHGCQKCSNKCLKYLSYEEAKIFIRNQNIKTITEYYDWWKLNKPNFLPNNIERYYKNNK